MVQNKDIEDEKVANGVKDENLTLGNCKKSLNGVHEQEEDSDEEDDYLKYLLVVPSLDQSVEERNMSLISQCLMNFYNAIESRKEYNKIRQELMESYVPSEIKKGEKIRETEVVDKLEVNGGIKSEHENEVIKDLSDNDNEEVIETKNFSLQLWKARLVPEHEPEMFEQFQVCRRCTIFFKTRKFRKMHNVINHRRKKKQEEQIEATKAKRIRVPGKTKEPRICDLCSKSFKIKALIRSHMNCHLSEKLHQCTECNYASKRYNDLRKHHEVHHNPNRIVQKRTRRRRCQECHETFADKKSLRTHKRLNHPKEKTDRKPRIFKNCEKCELALFSKKNFIEHMKEQHPEAMLIKCETCNRKFKTNFRLKKHISRYALAGKDCRIKVRKFGEFACEQCNMKFALKSYLSLHMRKHQTYTCEQCKESFKSQFSLKYHEFSHLEIEPKCLQCEKIFTSEQKFSNHLKRRTCMTNGHTPEIISTT